MILFISGLFIGSFVGVGMASLFTVNAYDKGYNDALKEIGVK